MSQGFKKAGLSQEKSTTTQGDKIDLFCTVFLKFRGRSWRGVAFNIICEERVALFPWKSLTPPLAQQAALCHFRRSTFCPTAIWGKYGCGFRVPFGFPLEPPKEGTNSTKHEPSIAHFGGPSHGPHVPRRKSERGTTEWAPASAAPPIRRRSTDQLLREGDIYKHPRRNMDLSQHRILYGNLPTMLFLRLVSFWWRICPNEWLGSGRLGGDVCPITTLQREPCSNSEPLISLIFTCLELGPFLGWSSREAKGEIITDKPMCFSKGRPIWVFCKGPGMKWLVSLWFPF